MREESVRNLFRHQMVICAQQAMTKVVNEWLPTMQREYALRASTMQHSDYTGYARVNAYMSTILKEMADELAHPRIIKATQSGTFTVRMQIYDPAFLDAKTPTYKKRSGFTGQVYTATANPRFSKYGWWRYFEFGVASRNWGSLEFGFVPGFAQRGGWMKKVGTEFTRPSMSYGDLTIGGDTVKVKRPHPGVAKMAVLKNTWKVFKPYLLKEMHKAYTKYFIDACSKSPELKRLMNI